MTWSAATLPSINIAANAPKEATISFTRCSSSRRFSGIFPPNAGSPHTTTWPPEHQSAKAASVAASLGSWTTAVTSSPAWSILSKESGSKIDPSVFDNLKNFFPNASCAAIFKSCTFEVWGNDMETDWPLGSETEMLTSAMASANTLFMTQSLTSTFFDQEAT